MSKKLYPEESIQAIADSIRSKRNVQLAHVGKMKTSVMADAIKGIRLGCPISVSVHMQDGVWVRPATWPNLDALTYGENEIYMTFDNSDDVDDSTCCFSISGTAYTVAIGTQTFEQADGSTFTYSFTESDGEFPLVHVTATGNITDFRFLDYTVNGLTYSAMHNPMVERVGHVYNYGATNWGTYYLEREKVGRSAASGEQLAITWYNCYSLQSLDLSGWDTTNWAVTSLYGTWNNCYSLQSLDLSGLGNLTATSSSYDFVGTFCNMINLRYLDISSIDLSKVTRIGQNDSSYFALKGQIETFKVGENNYNKFTSPSYAYFRVNSSCSHLTRTSLLEIGKMLGTVTTKHYLQIGTELSNLLTADEKAEITAKGWTIT